MPRAGIPLLSIPFLPQSEEVLSSDSLLASVVCGRRCTIPAANYKSVLLNGNQISFPCSWECGVVGDQL